MTVYAGQFGPEAQLATSSGALVLLPGESVDVFKRGTTTRVPLYTDYQKTATRANPVTTDSNGNLSFWADPDRLDIKVRGLTFPVNIQPDPTEIVTGSGSSTGGTGSGLSGILDLSTYCKGDGSDEHVAYKQAFIDAAGANKILYHPANLAVNVGAHVTAIPSNTQYWIEGRVYSAAATGDGSPQAAMAILEDDAWQSGTGTPSNIKIYGKGLFERTVDVAGTEGPYDCPIRIRGCTGLYIDVRTKGFLGGVLIEGCEDYEVRVTAYNPGDKAVGVAGVWGTAHCKNGRVYAVAYNAGFKLDGVTPVPSGVNGSAVVNLQSGSYTWVKAVNPLHNTFESGDPGVTDLTVDAVGVADLAGRECNVLIAKTTRAKVTARFELHNGGKGQVRVWGAAGQTQDAITVDSEVYSDYSGTAGWDNYAVRIADGSTGVHVKRAVGHGSGSVHIEGTGISGITVDAPYSRKAPGPGFLWMSGIAKVRGGHSIASGQDSSRAATDRAGMWVNAPGAGSALHGFTSDGGGGSAMQYGYTVLGGGTIEWTRNASSGAAVADINTSGSPAFTAPNYIDETVTGGGGGSLTFGAPVASHAGDVNSIGSGTDVSHANHVHGRDGQAGAAEVATGQSTTAAFATDLATAGPSVTVAIGPTGKVRVTLYARIDNSIQNGTGIMGFATSGANTIAAQTKQAIQGTASSAAEAGYRIGASFVLTGLAQGNTTFTAKYGNGTGGNTATFSDRQITAEPL